MFVFFNAEDSAISVTVEQHPVGSAYTAQQLADVLRSAGVPSTAEFYCSSSIDFAEEEGFASADVAHSLIENAIELL